MGAVDGAATMVTVSRGVSWRFGAVDLVGAFHETAEGRGIAGGSSGSSLGDLGRQYRRSRCTI